MYCFNEGQSPDGILEVFPHLTLAQIYGAIAFYLGHKAVIDQYLEDEKREFESQGIPLAEENPALWERIRRARAHAGVGPQGDLHA